MIGRKIKKYQLEELLGEGGMGVVYRARDIVLDRMVAIKMLHPGMIHQPDILKRFKNEAHVTARLSHPNIAMLYNFFTDEDQHCLVMEYVDGKTIEQILTIHKHVPQAECIRILQQLLEGLEEAHRNEILHRDIKPGNIMLNRSGYVKLMDFGVARIENSARLTRMNRVIGTLEYMAPELLTGSKPSPQTDLYSVGVAAYEMYTGKLPFEEHSDENITELIMQGTFSFPSNDLLPEARNKKLEQIIRKLMYKRTSRRYPDAGAVLEDLAGFSISGKASVSLLSEKPIVYSSEPNSRKKNGSTISDFIPNVDLNGLRISGTAMFFQLTRWSKHFIQTTEGKIIGAALAVAFTIVLFFGILANNDTLPETEEPISESAGQETASLIYDRSSVQPENRIQNPSYTEENVRGQIPSNPVDETPPSQKPVVRTPADRNETERPVSKPESIENEEKEVVEQPKTKDDPIVETEVKNEPENRESEREEPPVQVEEKPVVRTMEVQVSGESVEGIFNETVSTVTHKEGQEFYLITTGPVYSDGYKIIESGARIRGVVSQVRTRGNSRRAILGVSFKSVQAVDGSWLPISYPEYSDRATGNVSFEKGRAVSRLQISSGKVVLPSN